MESVVLAPSPPTVIWARNGKISTPDIIAAITVAITGLVFMVCCLVGMDFLVVDGRGKSSGGFGGGAGGHGAVEMNEC